MDKNFLEKKLEAFKQKWLQLKNEDPSEKVVWYFRKGIEKQRELQQVGQPIIVAECYFDGNDVLLLDDNHYPAREEYEDCKEAFSLGFFTNLHVYHI